MKGWNKIKNNLDKKINKFTFYTTYIENTKKKFINLNDSQKKNWKK